MGDCLAQDADLVIRFQGGDNAGHTVVNAYGKFALHLIPSGIFNPATVCIIGTGAVVNPATLLEEMGALEAAGVPGQAGQTRRDAGDPWEEHGE